MSANDLFPSTIEHASSGTSTIDSSKIAVRWREGASDDARAALLERAALSLASSEGERPGPAINNTDGLWWVHGAGDAASFAAAIDLLESSDIVEWVSPAYRAAASPAATAEGAPAADEQAAYFAVNPTRMLVREDAIDVLGGTDAIADVAPDEQRATRIPGLVALRIEQPSALAGRTALHAAESIASSLRSRSAAGTDRAVRFEHIPYRSPTCLGGDCRPPTADFTPDDPFFATQWGLERIGAPRAWQIARGDASITVAVLDEGVELGHPDLDVHPQSWNASTDAPDGSPTGNHGTACAGIVAARLDNGQGVSAIGGGARVMAIATATWADIDIAEGLYFAADNGARVVSMSFGVYPSWGAWDFDIVRDALQYAHDKGLVLVAASGNENGAEARFPGSDARTICVGGSNRDDERKRIGDASSEDWWGASYGPSLSVVAPCIENPTTDRLGGDGYAAGDYYDHFNGTSSATPHVAGLAALILSLRPSLSASEVRDILESTADKISPGTYAYAHDPSKPNGTWHEEVGYGRINAERALLAACATDADEHDDGCRGCGGKCSGETPEECRGPAPIPWLAFDRCMSFFEARVFDVEKRDDQRRLRLRVTYEHLLCMVGRQQGPLLFTTTLLPGESVQLYEFDRYRRTRSETRRMSVHTSFRQTMSALSQSRRASSAQAYRDNVTEVREHEDSSVSVGGGLAGAFGLPSGSTQSSEDSESISASGASSQRVNEQFTQIAVTSAQATEAERSVVISTFEDNEHQETTRRTLHNANECYAVTYYVRRVNEVYETATRVASVEWRVDGGPWREIDDLDNVPGTIREAIEQALKKLPKRGAAARGQREITLPTDGTLYEAELAHCSSCEPSREEAMRIELEVARLAARRACLEAELLELELDRRRRLAAGTDAVALDVGSWRLASSVSEQLALPEHTA